MIPGGFICRLRKEAELADLNNRIDTAANDMMNKISDINTELEKTKGTADEQKQIGNDKDKKETEDSGAGPSDVREQKNNRDKPVIYTKAGTANEQGSESESELSVLI